MPRQKKKKTFFETLDNKTIFTWLIAQEGYVEALPSLAPL
jgi:hypothetical protein